MGDCETNQAMKNLSRLRHGLPNTLATTLLIALCGFCSGIILARTLGPAHRGEFAAVILWPGMLALFGEFGLGFSLAYYSGKDQKSIDGLLTLAWTVGLVWGGVLTVGGWLILPFVLEFSQATMTALRWAMLSVPLLLITGYQGYILLGANHISRFNSIRLFGSLSYLVGVVAVATFGWSGVKNYTIIYLLSQGLTFLLATGLVILKFRPSLKWQPELISPVFIYAIKTHVSSIAAQANLRLDQLLMTMLVSSRQLGLYVVAVAISGMFSPLYNALAVVVLPRVSSACNLKQGGLQAVRHIHLGIVLGLPLSVLGIGGVPYLLPLVFGKDFSQAIVPAQILLCAAIFQGMNIVLGNSLRGLGHPGKTGVAEGVGLVVTIGLLWALLPKLGIFGAAIASLSAYLVVMLIQTIYVRRAAVLAWRDIWVFRWEEFLPDTGVFQKLRRSLTRHAKDNYDPQ